MSGNCAQTRRASIKRRLRRTRVLDTSQLQRLCHGIEKNVQSCRGTLPMLLPGALPSWYTLGGVQELEERYVDAVLCDGEKGCCLRVRS
jgi:hypothetical protein